MYDTRISIVFLNETTTDIIILFENIYKPVYESEGRLMIII